jgi:phage terminase large subunit
MTLGATLLNNATGLHYDTVVYRSTIAGLDEKYPLIVHQGGTSSGKTFSILLAIVMHLKWNTGLVCSVVSCTYPHLKRGAVRDFLNIMDQVKGLQEWNKSDLSGKINGNTIEFFSADNDGKVRGSKRDILFLNEANLNNYERYRQLSIRTSTSSIIDFNPTSEFWFHTDVLPALEPQDYVYKRTTYKDNPAVSEKIAKDIESLKYTNENLYKVYALGKTGSNTGLIFPNFTLIDYFPKECKKQGYGLDFGFTNDPTALVRIGFLGDYLYLDEVIYETNLTNPDISDKLKSLGINRRDEIVADSAEPKSIEELRRMGWNIRGANKREIVFGVDVMKRYKLAVTKTSLNLQKELRNYAWKVDANGKTLNIPIDGYNHALDAARYITLFKLSGGLPSMI